MSKFENVRTRFAPSPTGYLHIGGLRTALYSYLFAAANNGKFILRIEDTDLNRYVEGSVEIIYRTLKDAGLFYDEGPDVGGPFAPYIQSERKACYLQYAEQMIENGSAYYCFCSKERLSGLQEQGAEKYDKHCEKLSRAEAKKRVGGGEPYVIRQNIPVSGATSYNDLVFGEITVENKDMEDNILIKSDGMPTYNFANVVDDHLMNITFVMRGTEYLSSTPKYNLIYKGLGWQPPNYIHLPPIMKDATHKLSKRNGDASYEDFINKGYLKEAIVNYIALLGWSPKQDREKFSLLELKELFGVEGLSKSAAIFDEVKMKWLNSLYIKELSDEQYLEYAREWLDKSIAKDKYDYNLLARLLKGRTEILSDIPRLVQFLEWKEDWDLNLLVNPKQKSDFESAKKVLPAAGEFIAKLDGYDNLYERLVELCKSLGVKNSTLLWALRVSITGAESTPGGATDMIELLGASEAARRIDCTLKRLL